MFYNITLQSGLPICVRAVPGAGYVCARSCAIIVPVTLQ